MNNKMKVKFAEVTAVFWLLSQIQNVGATEFATIRDVVPSMLKTTKPSKRTIDSGQNKIDVFYSKDSSGKLDKAVFIEKGLYEPNCTHTWAVGVDGKTSKITDIRTIEMSCPHAYPTKDGWFIEQFKGVGPADVAKLDGKVHKVNKATGSSVLLKDAVKRSIANAQKLKGTI